MKWYWESQNITKYKILTSSKKQKHIFQKFDQIKKRSLVTFCGWMISALSVDFLFFASKVDYFCLKICPNLFCDFVASKFVTIYLEIFCGRIIGALSSDWMFPLPPIRQNENHLSPQPQLYSNITFPLLPPVYHHHHQYTTSIPPPPPPIYQQYTTTTSTPNIPASFLPH